MQYNINYHNVLDYVLGTSQYHPFEVVLDPMRYEFFEDHVFDRKTNSMIPQSKEYSDFFSSVRWLKDYQSSLEREQVFGACRMIEQRASFPIILNS